MRARTFERSMTTEQQNSERLHFDRITRRHGRCRYPCGNACAGLGKAKQKVEMVSGSHALRGRLQTAMIKENPLRGLDPGPDWMWYRSRN